MLLQDMSWRSPSVFADYYKQHDKFEEDHRDGFQTVGDIAGNLALLRRARAEAAAAGADLVVATELAIAGAAAAASRAARAASKLIARSVRPRFQPW